MQQVPLLQTKLYIPPTRARLVSRLRLIEQLDAGQPHALTLVSAPAGFGKTTLVSEWVTGCEQPAAWLSLDEGDNDPARFLAYVIAALQTVEASIGQGALSALRSPQPPPAEAVLIPVINDLAALPDGLILVLDDYHLIEIQEIHDALAFLLQHLPPRIRLAIATREDPPLPFARLRARGQLTELRATDLRFTTSEAAEFLNQVMGLDLAAEDIAALETRTEGWIAGLQLAAVALQGIASQDLVLPGTFSVPDRKEASSLIRSFAGSHRFVLDYLVEEVLHQQSDSVQAFLLQTAVLDRLTGPLCDAVYFGSAKAPDGQAILAMLDRANLFVIPLDDERRWYRYHHLFSGLLRQRLRQTQPDWVPTLHLRASEWYEQNGFPIEAIEHALQAEEFSRAVRLIENQADASWTRDEHMKLRRWLAGLPEDAILRRPFLCVFHAWFLFAKGPREEAEQYLQAAEQALDTDTMPPEQRPLTEQDRRKLRGRVAVIRAFMASYLGDVPAIIEHSRQALELLPESDLSWRSSAAIALGDAHGFRGDMEPAYEARLQAAEAGAAAGSTIFSILAYVKVAITLREQGHLQRTIDVCRRQLELAGRSGLSQGTVAGCLWALWAEVLAELGDLEGALAQARRGVEYAERGLDWSLFGWSCLCLIRVLFSAGDMAGAQEVVQKVENATREAVLPPWITNQTEAWQMRLWLAQGKLGSVAEWVHARELLVAGESQSSQELDFFALDDQVTLARVLIAQERLDAANRLLPRLLKTAETKGRTSKSIEILILQALALQAGGDTAPALTTLERALALAQPEGFLRTFIDEGPAMARLLDLAAVRGVMPDYTARLLAAFQGTTEDKGPMPAPSSSVVHPSPLVEPLSERELEVLQLVAEGLTNREIASRLYVSLNTVKAHTRNIYGKLGVHSRTQATARSTELGLLPRREV